MYTGRYTYLIIVIITFAVATTVGCYGHNPMYPSEWPQLIDDASIESRIEGVYQCWGEIVGSGYPSSWTITDFLIVDTDPRSILVECDFIEIKNIEPDELQFLYFRLGKEELKQVYKRNKDYQVDGRWIFIKTRRWTAKSHPYGGGDVDIYHFSNTSLTINIEQDLIIKIKHDEYFLGCLFPIVTLETLWGKFKRKH
jgi:hypothetical protein